MSKFEFFNGAFHIVAAFSYGLICFKAQAFDVYALLAIAMSGIGVCYIGRYIDDLKKKDKSDNS